MLCIKSLGYEVEVMHHKENLKVVMVWNAFFVGKKGLLSPCMSDTDIGLSLCQQPFIKYSRIDKGCKVCQFFRFIFLVNPMTLPPPCVVVRGEKH